MLYNDNKKDAISNILQKINDVIDKISYYSKYSFDKDEVSWDIAPILNICQLEQKGIDMRDIRSIVKSKLNDFIDKSQLDSNYKYVTLLEIHYENNKSEEFVNYICTFSKRKLNFSTMSDNTNIILIGNKFLSQYLDYWS